MAVSRCGATVILFALALVGSALGGGVQGRGQQAAGMYCVLQNTSAANTYTIETLGDVGDRSLCVAIGEYNNSMMQIGWEQIKVNSSASFADEVQAYGAGFFEGAMLYVSALKFHTNFVGPRGVFPTTNSTMRFLKANAVWIEQMVAANKAKDPYWNQVGLQWTQFMGVVAGYQYARPAGARELTFDMALDLAAAADTTDINNINYPTNWQNMSKKDFTRWMLGNSHCSALVKLTPTMDNIYFAHDTWLFFTAMLRVFKTYTLNYADPSTKAKTVQFSGFPGFISSTDDFYAMDSGLHVLETTLTVFNFTIYNGNVVPQSVLSWMRVLVANRMSASGKEWTENFARYNSGTYNDEWLVLDYKLFTPYEDLLPGTLYVLDQMPGMIAVHDVTRQLSYGYFPSYNIPYSETVFNYAGYPAAVALQGPEMNDYQTCVRAQIFREIEGNISTIEDMKYTMHYNHYQTNPISQDNPGYAIAARMDLTPASEGGAFPFGAIDSKITDFYMWQSGAGIHAYAGPTPQQPTFSFSAYIAAGNTIAPHEGIPDTMNFTWGIMSPAFGTQYNN